MGFRCEQMPPRVGIGVNESNTCWSKDQRYIRQKRRPTNERDRESKEPAGRRRYGRAGGDEMNVEAGVGGDIDYRARPSRGLSALSGADGSETRPY